MSDPNEAGLKGVYDLLVVGAGPIGLATAIAAHKRGCRNVLIVEQAREFKPVGEFIDINSNGIRALRYLVPQVAEQLCATVRDRGVGQQLRLLDVKGNLLSSSAPRPPADEPRVNTSWYAVQTMLREALPKDIIVRTNSQLVGLADEDDGTIRAELLTNRVRLNPFAHWERDPAAELTSDGISNSGANGEPKTMALRARLVIAADGINSFTRSEVYRRMYGESSESFSRANYSGLSSFNISGFTPAGLENDAKKVQELYLVNGQGGCLVGSEKERAKHPGAPTVLLVRIDGEVARMRGFEWKIFIYSAVPEALVVPEQRYNGYPGLVDTVVEQLRWGGFPECMVRLIQGIVANTNGNNPESVCRPLYIVPMTSPPPYELPATATHGTKNFKHIVGHGRIFLVGDALHGMPPFISQGTAQGWEDVVELIDLLANELGWADGRHDVPHNAKLDQLRSKFIDARIERICFVQTETMAIRWAYNMDLFNEKQQHIYNYQPVAKGWSLT